MRFDGLRERASESSDAKRGQKIKAAAQADEEAAGCAQDGCDSE